MTTKSETEAALDKAREFIAKIANQVCHHGRGMRIDACLEETGRRCDPCEARRVLIITKVRQ